MPLLNRDLTNFGHNYAAIIGITDYSLSVGPLSTPVNDAQKFKEVLTTVQGFPDDEDHLFFKPNATKADFEALWAWMASRPLTPDGHPSRINDSFVFYFAGHGLAGDLTEISADAEDGERPPAGYLLPKDTNYDEPRLSQNPTLVKMEDLIAALKNLGCHHTLVILDCCFSGTFRRADRSRGGGGLVFRPLTEARFNRYVEKKAWQVLASAGPTEEAADRVSIRGDLSTNAEESLRAEHSPFAIALFDALGGQRVGQGKFVKALGQNLGDGVLTMGEIFNYVHDEVEAITRSEAAFDPQNPSLFPFGQDEAGQFVFLDPRFAGNEVQWAQLKKQNPFPGLSQFDVDDQPYYFGREQDIEKVMEVLKPENGAAVPPVLMVSGASGVGKSSFVKAGILSQLKQEYELYQIRPGERPWELRQYITDQEPGQSWSTVLSLADLLLNLPADQTPSLLGGSSPLRLQETQILLIDQYEELFTSSSDAERRALELALIELIEEALKPTSKLKIFLTVRSDFEWQLEVSEIGKKYWAERNIYYHFCRLSSLGLDQLRDALVNPALVLAFDFQKTENQDLTDIILEDLDYLPSALPLLSYTMHQMAKRIIDVENDDREFKIEVYQNDIGGVSGAMQKRLQELHDQLSPEEQALMRQVILRMVDQRDGEYARRMLIRSADQFELQFTEQMENNTAVEDLIQVLVDEDLVAVGGLLDDLSYVELVHDSLINTGSLCKTWIQAFGKENLLLQRQVWQATLEYEKADEAEAEDFLWHENPKIVQLKSILDGPQNWLNFKEAAFVNRSWVKRQDELERVKRERDAARSSALAAKGLLIYDANNTLAYNLAVQAYKKAKTDDALNTIVDTSSRRSLFYKRFSGHSQAITAIDYLPDGQSFVTASDDATAIHWKSDGSRIFSGHRLKILDMGISPDGEWLVTGSHDKQIGIWNLKDENMVPVFLQEHSAPVTSICFSPVALSLAEEEEPLPCFLSGSTDNRVLLWDLAGNLRREYQYQREGVVVHQIWSVAFSRNGQEILAGTGNGWILHWQLDGEVIPDFGIPPDSKPHSSIVSAVAMHASMEIVMSGGAAAQNGEENKVLLWRRNEATGKFDLDPEVVDRWGNTGAIEFLRDRDQLVMTSHAGRVYVGRVTKWDPQRIGTRGQAIMCAAFSPDGRHLLLGDGNGDYLLYYLSGQIEEEFLGYGAFQSPILFVPPSFTPEDFDLEQDALFVGSSTGEGFLVNTKNKNHRAITEHDATLREAALSGDKRFLLTGGMDGKVKSINYHDAPAWERSVDGHIKAVAISHNGLLKFAATGEREVLIWMGSAQEANKRETTHGVRALAISSDDQYLLIGCSSGKVLYWDMDKNIDISLEAHNPVFDINSVAISPDGNLLLTGGGDGKAILWEKDGTLIREIPKEAGQVRCVRFSEDGAFILITGENGAAVIYDAAGNPLQELANEQLTVWSGDFSPDGRYVATKLANGKVRLWRNYYVLWHQDWMEHLTHEEQSLFGVN